MPIYCWPGIGAKAAWWWENCLCEAMMSRSRADLITPNLTRNSLPTLLSNQLVKLTRCLTKTPLS